jgi:hypothetical protein
LQEAAKKVEKASLNWAKLIARIYETNPLICSCGREIKIAAFITHSAEIHRILSGIGWPTEIPDFDPAYDITHWDICQLVPGTGDGFQDIYQNIQCEAGPDPPNCEEYCDPPHWENHRDPPHSED